MIVLNDVSKIYQIGESEVYALDHASMRVGEGEFVSIIGPSGSGKSTMMNIIGCLDMADSGQYLLDGQPIEEYTAENIELPLIYQKIPREERKERVAQALEKVRLAGRGRHKPNELSGGQQQRVAIARAIASRPSLFLADEPTVNLDSATGKEIMELFHGLHRQGSTIVLITHDDSIARQADRSGHILDGKIREVAR